MHTTHRERCTWAIHCGAHSPARRKNLPAIPCDFAGGGAGALQEQQQGLPTTGEVESVGQNMLSVRFEINIIKVLVVNSVLDLI